MALRDGYVLDQVSAAIRAGYDLDQTSGAIAAAYDAWFVSRGVSLPGMRRLRGRRNVAVPAGVVLPPARGGTPPYTYSVEDLPTGAQFAAATRTLSGSPSAAGENTVTYKAEDADGNEAVRTFAWDVLDVLATDAVMLQDFDGGKVGYGVSDFAFAFAGTYISGTNLGFTNATPWAGSPRTAVGSVVDDPYARLTLPTGGLMSRIDYRAGDNPDRLRLFDSNEDLDGNAVDSDIGAWARANGDLNLYLQRSNTTVGVTLSFDDDLESSAVWHATFELTAAQSTWVRANLSEDDQFLLVIA